MIFLAFESIHEVRQCSLGLFKVACFNDSRNFTALTIICQWLDNFVRSGGLLFKVSTNSYLSTLF